MRASSREGSDSRPSSLAAKLQNLIVHDKQSTDASLNESNTKNAHILAEKSLNNAPLMHKPRPPQERYNFTTNPRVNNLVNGSVEKEKLVEKSKDSENNISNDPRNYRANNTLEDANSSSLRRRSLKLQSEQNRNINNYTANAINENSYQNVATGSTIDEE